jgi:hypothetical protein
MANTRSQKRRTRSYRGESKRTSGSGALLDTVRSTLTQFSRNSGRASRSGGLTGRASGLLGGLLRGNDSRRGRRRR